MSQQTLDASLAEATPYGSSTSRTVLHLGVILLQPRAALCDESEQEHVFLATPIKKKQGTYQCTLW